MVSTVFNPFHKSDFPETFWSLRSVPPATHYVIFINGEYPNTGLKMKCVLPCMDSIEAEGIRDRLAQAIKHWGAGPPFGVQGPPRNRKGTVIVVMDRGSYPMWYQTNKGEK